MFIPGASLMEITPCADGGLRVRCPGCGHEEDYRGTGHRVFQHADHCAVYARIAEAIEIYRRDVVKQG